MTTKEKQIRFWTKLKESDQKLFDGTPGETQYYNIVNKEILPLKIRLDIYCCEEDYQSKGYLTICVMLPEDKMEVMSRSFAKDDVRIDQKLSRFFWVSNHDKKCLIGDNEADWKNAIEWFTKNVQNITNVLR